MAMGMSGVGWLQASGSSKHVVTVDSPGFSLGHWHCYAPSSPPSSCFCRMR